MGSVVDREQMMEHELLDRVTKEPEVREPPIGPPPRRPFVRWIEWASFALIAVAAVIAAAVILSNVFDGDEELAADVLITDEAQSGLAVSPRQIDATYEITERWVGESLEATAEDLRATMLVADEAQSVLAVGPRQIDATYDITERWVGESLEATAEETTAANPAIQGSVLYPNPEIGTLLDQVPKFTTLLDQVPSIAALFVGGEIAASDLDLSAWVPWDIPYGPDNPELTTWVPTWVLRPAEVPYGPENPELTTWVPTYGG